MNKENRNDLVTLGTLPSHLVTSGDQSFPSMVYLEAVNALYWYFGRQRKEIERMNKNRTFAMRRQHNSSVGLMSKPFACYYKIRLALSCPTDSSPCNIFRTINFAKHCVYDQICSYAYAKVMIDRCRDQRERHRRFTRYIPRSGGPTHIFE